MRKKLYIFGLFGSFKWENRRQIQNLCKKVMWKVIGKNLHLGKRH